MWPRMGPNHPPGKPKDDKPNPDFKDMDDKSLAQSREEFIFNKPPIFEPVRRQNIIGIDHILNKIDLYIKLLQNFNDLEKHGAELDTGLIFTGAPGSGKTFMARYVATQSGARFINVCDFPKKNSCFSADDVLALFNLMKQFVSEENKPIVAFWDEFETFTATGEDAKKIDALSRFKTELSGIKGKMRGVFLIVATNRPDLIPDDVSRPGRLGRKIRFGALRRYAKRLLFEHLIWLYNHEEKIDFESLSYLVSADYPAEIEELVKEAWRNAVMEVLGTDKKACLTNSSLAKTLINETRGNPSDITLSDDELRAISIYEIGRAIVARTLKSPVQLLAIQRDGYADALRTDQQDYASVHIPLSRMETAIAIRYGGIIAQELCGIGSNLKQITDFTEITTLAQRLIEQFRTSKMTTDMSISMLAEKRSQQGLPSVETSGMNTLHETTEEIRNLLTKQQALVKSIFEHYGLTLIEKMSANLIEKGFLLQMDIDAMLEPEYVPTSDTGKKTKKPIGFLK